MPKDVERWWLKYEAASNLDKEFPPHPDLTFSLLSSVHRHRLKHTHLAENLKEDSRHHIAMQKFFKKWQEIHGTRL